MDVIGGKWNPLILGKIQEKLPKTSQKMLARVEYALTARRWTVIPLPISLKDRANVDMPDQINESG